MNNTLLLMEGHSSSELLLEFGNYSKDLVKGTELTPSAMNWLSNGIEMYMNEPKAVMVINTASGETTKMSIMEILWKRYGEKGVEQSDYWDEDEKKIIKKNFMKLKPKGKWSLFKHVSKKNGEVSYSYANYDLTDKYKDVDTELVKTV